MSSSKRPAGPRKHTPALGITKSTAPLLGGSARAPMATLIDDESLEEARLASLRASSSPPRIARSSRPASTESAPPLGPLALAHRLAASGDQLAAIAHLEQFLRARPKDASTKGLAEDFHRALSLPQERRFGSFGRVPVLAVPRKLVPSLALDHHSGFLLGFVDGDSNLEAILDMSGFSPPELLGAFASLHERGIVTFRD